MYEKDLQKKIIFATDIIVIKFIFHIDWHTDIDRKFGMHFSAIFHSQEFSFNAMKAMRANQNLNVRMDFVLRKKSFTKTRSHKQLH